MTRTTRIIVAVALIAGAAAAYWFLALAPKRDQIAKLDGQISTKQAEVQQAETTANHYEASRKAYAKNYATVVRLGKAVPAEDDVRSLVVQLDSSAKRTRVDFSALNVGAGSSGSPAAPTTPGSTTGAKTPPPGATAVGSGGFMAMPFSFTFQGSFFRLGDFFARLQNYVTLNQRNVDVTGRLLRVETFKLTPNANSSTLKAEVGATSYILPPKESLTGGATPQGPGSATAKTPAGNTTTATAGVIR